MNTINDFQDRKKNYISFFNSFKKLFNEGVSLGINIEGISEKIDSVIQSIEAETIKVALVGGFSEGKTSVAAGWLGKIESNMKIDPDESSDAIQVYRPIGIEKDCIIIDTPGLYGEKTFSDGEQFKTLTLEYVSEAHLILYVLDPVNPIKDSHAETVKWLFRDLNKIESVVFVLNKMDEVADLTDEEDFNSIFEIKKNNIIKSLERLIGLTSTEANMLNIIGISANPKGKGLDFWLNRKEDYIERSRIKLLNNKTNEIISKSKQVLIENSAFSSIKDLIIRNVNATMPILENLNFEIKNRKDSLAVTENDFQDSRRKILAIRQPMTEELINYKNELLSKFKGADVNTIQEYVTEEIGDNAINFEIRISNIINRYINEISGISASLGKSIENELEFTESLFNKHQGYMKSGISTLKSIPVNQWHGVINNTRHFLNSTFKTSIKFKPWGITKLAKGTTTVIASIGILFECIEMYQTYKAKQKCNKIKEDMCKLINESIDEQLLNIKDEDKFFKSFAPHLEGLQQSLKDLFNLYNDILNKKNKIESWIHNIKNYSDSKIEDVEFEEVNIS